MTETEYHLEIREVTSPIPVLVLWNGTELIEIVLN